MGKLFISFFRPSILVYSTYNIYHGVYFNVAPPSSRVQTSRSSCQPLVGLCPDPRSGVLVHLPPGSGQLRTPPTPPPPTASRVHLNIWTSLRSISHFYFFSRFFYPIPPTPYNPVWTRHRIGGDQRITTTFVITPGQLSISRVSIFDHRSWRQRRPFSQ